jgi:hypothetical protein
VWENVKSVQQCETVGTTKSTFVFPRYFFSRGTEWTTSDSTRQSAGSKGFYCLALACGLGSWGVAVLSSTYIHAVLKNKATGFSETSVTIHMTLWATAHNWSSLYIRKAVQLYSVFARLKSGRDNRQSPPEDFCEGKKGKVHSITGDEGPEEEYRYSSTLYLTSALDGVGWSKLRSSRFTPRKDPAPTL